MTRRKGNDTGGGSRSERSKATVPDWGGEDGVPIILVDDLEAALAPVLEAPLPPAPPELAPLPSFVTTLPTSVEPWVEAYRLSEEEILEGISAEIDGELAEERSREESFWYRHVSLRRLGWAGVGILVLLLGFIYAVGRPYYQLALVERPYHVFHATLRPSGAVGLPLAVVGTALMLVSVSYLVRKRSLRWGQSGALKGWLGFHILTGVLGSACILLHASFLPYSAFGVLCSFALTIVLGSGIFGRYIMAFVPRSIHGGELDRRTVRRRLVVYQRKLAALGVDPALLEEKTSEAEKAQRYRWLPKAFRGVLYGDLESRREFRSLREAARARGRRNREAREIVRLARRLCRERQWLVRTRELRRIIGTWRFLHRWLAIVLGFGVFFHILVAVRFGGLWILGGRG